MFICLFLITASISPFLFADEEENFRSQIFVGNVDGSDMKRLVDIATYQSHGSPSWSQDGKRITFDAWQSQKGQRFSDGHVFVVNSDGTNPRDIGPGFMPSLSPKGHRVAFTRMGDENTGGVWIAEVEDPTACAQIDPSGWGTDWSPNGLFIAYTRGGELILFDTIEGTLRPVFNQQSKPFSQIQWNFNWSSDSRQIAFKAITEDQRSVLATVDVFDEKHEVKVIYEGNFQPGVSWHPNRQQIFVSMPDPDHENLPRIFRVNVQPPGPPVLLSHQPPDRKLHDPAISPDGKRLAVLAFKRVSPTVK